MTRLFTNSDLLFILGECNIYYINYKYILLYLGLANTTFNNQYVYKNKKISLLCFLVVTMVTVVTSLSKH